MKRILIVDDSPTMRRMVQASLRDIKEVRYEEAGSGLEAIEQLALTQIDLILLDLNMPDMHGLEVLRFVRGYEAYCKIPIIILTTRDDKISKETVLAAGASLYLTKPFAPQVLAAKVREFLISD
jgi:two-component system, chemotaxis family, chemotaxis protein CheY